MKTRKIRLLDRAVEDLEHAMRFYDSCGFNVGKRFIGSVFKDIESLSFSAGIHAIHFNCYRLLSKKFPFAIYYKISKDMVEIIAVLDLRQRADNIEKIISESKSGLKQ